MSRRGILLVGALGAVAGAVAIGIVVAARGETSSEAGAPASSHEGMVTGTEAGGHG